MALNFAWIFANWKLEYKIDSRMKLNLYSTTLIIFECGTIQISVVNLVASLN